MRVGGQRRIRNVGKEQSWMNQFDFLWTRLESKSVPKKQIQALIKI